MLRETFQKWCITGLFCIATLSVQAQTSETADREAKWQQDIQVFVDTLSAHKDGQKDFAKVYPPASFHAAIASLKADIPKLSDDEIGLRLMQIMASAHVSHNMLWPQGPGFVARLPVRFHWYSDGLAVDAAAQEYADTLGARVVKIRDNTPEELLAKIAPYIAHENDPWLRLQLTKMIRGEAMLRHFELIGPDGRVAITLEKPGQPPFTVPVVLADPNPKLVRLSQALNLPIPLYLTRQTQNYWYQYLADSQTLYIQYNMCKDDPKLSFKDFTKQVLAEADAHPVKRVVIDLRLNDGGDSAIIDPLQDGLDARLKSIGHLFVLIGPGTFSSAMMNALFLQRGINSRGRHENLKAILVGEPTGDGLNTLGNARPFVLPNSKITGQYTTKLIGNPKAAPVTPQPDIAAPRTLASDLAGRDPALEAAIAAQ